MPNTRAVVILKETSPSGTHILILRSSTRLLTGSPFHQAMIPLSKVKLKYIVTLTHLYMSSKNATKNVVPKSLHAKRSSNKS